MYHVFRLAAIVLVLLPVAGGCSSMPRWDWWRSAQTGPPPEAMMAKNNAPKYPNLPSTNATPANLTASTGTTNGVPAGTSAPTMNAPSGGYPTTDTATAGTTMPASYPSTGATGAYPSTAGGYGPQTGSYDPNAYNPYAGGAQPAAHVASNPNSYGASTGGYTNPAPPSYPMTGAYPTTNTTNAPAAYPATNDNNAANYGMPSPPGAAPASTDPNGYGSGSRYDAPAADRYGTPASSGYPPPANNYGAPANAYPTNSYPTAPPAGAYQGSDASAPPGNANYAATGATGNDRYSTYGQTGATTGPTATTADLRSDISAPGTPRYDSQVTPTSGGTYLPAGTKLLEGEMPSNAPAATPSSGASPSSSSPTSSPYGYQTPGATG